MLKVISYDLRKVRDYEDLYKAIKKYPGAKKILESLWLIDTDSTCLSIAEELFRYMDNDDGIFVAQCDPNYAMANLIE